VVVLHEDDGALVADLVDDGVGEAPVDLDVLPPVVFVEDRPRVGDVAERPERAVGQAVVVALFLAVGQPDATQRVRRLIGGDRRAAGRLRRGANRR